MAREIHECLVSKVIQETSDVKTLHIDWPAGVDYAFKTGQFITIYLPEDPKTKRAYSLSSCELDRGFFEITIKRMGNFGTRINDVAKEGMKLMVIPPVGKFNLPEDPKKDLVCIAGGSGVTPFRGFVRHCKVKRPETKITILYSVRIPDDIIFNNEFTKLEAEYPNFSFKVTCTRATPEKGFTGTWNGHQGRIDATWVKEHVRDQNNTVFYACGPNELVEATEELVISELGVPKEQMRTEYNIKRLGSFDIID
jgi:ferredoxin-NADP reductase